MNRDNKLQLNDELIRQALRHDLEKISPPSPEKTWAAIEAGFQQAPFKKTSQISFRKLYFAYAAAAVVLMAFGSFSLHQLLDSVAPAAEGEPAFDAVEEILPAAREEAAEALFVTEDEPAAGFSAPLAFLAEQDQKPPPWQESLNDDYILGEKLLLSAVAAPDYHGALYYGPEATLLRVKSFESVEELPRFIETVGLHLEQQTEVTGLSDGKKSFEAAGLPGLAWQNNGYNEAILVLNGFVSPEKLTILADSLSEKMP